MREFHEINDINISNKLIFSCNVIFDIQTIKHLNINTTSKVDYFMFVKFQTTQYTSSSYTCYMVVLVALVNC